MALFFRSAEVDDVHQLNDLTGRSALHWGYEPEFLEWEPQSITVTAASILEDQMMVAELDGVAIGYYGLRGTPDDLSLDKLFVEPTHIGTGVGKELWNHAMATCRCLGATGISFYSDPNAAGFYRAMGATWIREVETSRPGWNLQVFSYRLSPESPE
ncbi:MAG: GNAT family N-acetyltransferase [Thermomicrobiales bacterium]